MLRSKLMHFDLSVGAYSAFVPDIIQLARKRLSSNVCIAAVHMFVEAWLDSSYQKVINSADIITPDGKPLTWALRLLYGIRQDRVAGSDILPELLRECEKQQLTVFFYGCSQHLLDETSKFLSNQYPALKIAGLYSPPFRELTESENIEIVKKINDVAPNIVIVILGCPKQEKWSAYMKGKIHSVMVAVGGALPIVIGIQKRAPQWMQRSGLEWVHRLSVEPRRLFKRYAVTNTLFVYIIFREYLRRKIFRNRIHYDSM